jgi:hypothetical protein
MAEVVSTSTIFGSQWMVLTPKKATKSYRIIKRIRELSNYQKNKPDCEV